MRIANNKQPVVKLFTLLTALGSLSAMPAYAVDAVVPAVVAAPVPVADIAPIAPVTPAAPKEGGITIEKKMTAMEDKVIDGVKNTVKGLDSAEGMTLSDLNTAKQTMVRIETMIEIEKRMLELEKLRNERGGVKPAFMAPAFAGAIPASALAPLPQVSRPAFSDASADKSARVAAAPVAVETPHYDILRIIGADGKYSAVLKEPNGTQKTVRVGDEAAGGTVRWITASTVVIEGKNKTTTLRIKNVDLVSTAMR